MSPAAAPVLDVPAVEPGHREVELYGLGSSARIVMVGGCEVYIPGWAVRLVEEQAHLGDPYALSITSSWSR